MQAEKTGVVKITYNGIDITNDISVHIERFTYIDHVKGKVDEIEIVLNNSSGLFTSSWAATKGDTIFASIDDIECGKFTIDEISSEGPPDIVTWKCISLDNKAKQRSKKSQGFEQITLLDLAKKIASNNNLELDDGTQTITTKQPSTAEEQIKLKGYAESFLKLGSQKDREILQANSITILIQARKTANDLGKKGYSEEKEVLMKSFSAYQSSMTNANAFKLSTIISKVRIQLIKEPAFVKKTLGLGLGNIVIERVTQNNNNDLSFLAEISNKYGLAFNIKPPKLVFYSTFKLEDAPANLVIKKSEVSSYSFISKTENTFKNVKVKYHNPNTDELVESDDDAPNKYEGLQSGDTLFINKKVENKEQANAVAKSELHNMNSKTKTGSISVKGNMKYLAGMQFNALGFGVNDAKYFIDSSTHTVEKTSGYRTDVEFKSSLKTD